MFDFVLTGVSFSQRFDFLPTLGPGWPSAGGPRMDRPAVTSPEVVNISRLVSRLPSIDSMTNQPCMKQ